MSCRPKEPGGGGVFPAKRSSSAHSQLQQSRSRRRKSGRAVPLLASFLVTHLDDLVRRTPKTYQSSASLTISSFSFTVTVGVPSPLVSSWNERRRESDAFDHLSTQPGGDKAAFHPGPLQKDEKRSPGVPEIPRSCPQGAGSNVADSPFSCVTGSNSNSKLRTVDMAMTKILYSRAVQNCCIQSSERSGSEWRASRASLPASLPAFGRCECWCCSQSSTHHLTIKQSKFRCRAILPRRPLLDDERANAMWAKSSPWRAKLEPPVARSSSLC